MSEELELLGLPKPKVKKERPKNEVQVAKTTADIQRMQLEKLMKNVDKPVVIPERKVDKKELKVPDFVRNVMGSSAGAGSGEFHVYRQLRRKECIRQKLMDEAGEKERLDREFQERIEKNKREAAEKTAKKRAKRLKKKMNKKNKTGNAPAKKESDEESDSEEEDECPAESPDKPSDQ